jgi:hypothetical protein
MSVDVFISYSHKDRRLREQLARHLSALRNQGIINDWFDGDIIEGQEWEKELLEHLNTAQVILLLVSPDFIASTFCYQIEMTRALERHHAGHACVIPIILRPTDWKDTPFAKIKALPTDGRPITTWRSRDEALLDVVTGIKRAIKELQNSKSRAKTNNGPSTIQIGSDQQHAAHLVQPEMPRPAKTGRTINTIGSIAGHHNQINQAEILHPATYNYYGPDPWPPISPAPKTGADPDGSTLASFQALVAELHTILDNQLSTSQKVSHPQIDPERLTLFLNMMAVIAPHAATLPVPLLTEVRRLCQRLHVVPLF